LIFNIPQFIDKEDKIVGPLTAKQLGWLALGGITLLILWATLDSQGFYISLLPVIGISVAFAFYRPYNQSLVNFITSSFLFFSHNKVYSWKRLPGDMTPVKKAPHKNISQQDSKDKMNTKKIGEISKLLDIKTKN